MPVYRSRTVLEIARGLQAFLNLDAGLTRSAVPDPEQLREQLQQARLHITRLGDRLSNKDRQLKQTQEHLSASSASTDASSIKPGNIVWIFGFGRSGSSWLRSMMTELEDHQLWEEPLVGLLFGSFYDTWCTGDPRGGNRKDFVFGSPRKAWLNLIRSFVIERIKAQFPEIGSDILIVKEPNGSIGAPLLMEALPESRMILLVRDPRDVAASWLDAHKEGGWLYEALNPHGFEDPFANNNPDVFVKRYAEQHLRSFSYAKQAYDAHEGRKVLIKYEDLRADTLSNMKRIYSTLGLAVDEEELAQVVEKHSWGNAPEEYKGEGRFHRKATPGAWNEDLTAEQIEIVEKVFAPVLNEFYPRANATR